MMPMLPLCNSRPMIMPGNSCMMGIQPAMIPMVPMVGAPMMCQPNMNMFSTTSIMSEFDSHMYGRFRHVERENPRYRHAPFDWYRPPKQRHNVIHEDAAVVTLDGPVPIGDFYRYYIYGDDMDDDYDYYDDDDGSSSFDSEEYDDLGGPSYEPRSQGYRRTARDFDDDIDPINRSSMRPSGYSPISPARRTPATRGTRTIAGDDEFDDAASVNSTYAN